MQTLATTENCTISFYNFKESMDGSSEARSGYQVGLIFFHIWKIGVVSTSLSKTVKLSKENI
jgi:hypothetical protein